MSSKATDVRILDAKINFVPVQFRAPLKFGGRIVTETKLINSDVTIQRRDGRRASGHGSMPVGNVWAWPSEQIAPPDAERAMMMFAESVSELFASYPDYGHPLEIQYAVGVEFQHQADRVARKLELAESLPTLARLVAVSPIDAALHDALWSSSQQQLFQCLVFPSTAMKISAVISTISLKTSSPISTLVASQHHGYLCTIWSEHWIRSHQQKHPDWRTTDSRTHLPTGLPTTD